MDPLKIRPRRDFVTVKADPRKEVTGGGLYLPPSETGVEKVTERAGVILRIGTGDKIAQLGVKEGDRIVYRGFLKAANPIETDDGSEVFLMSVDDILAVVDTGVEVGCFSGRPQVPEVK